MQPEHTEIKENFVIQVYIDDTHPCDITDSTTFETEEDFKKWLNEFEQERRFHFGVVVYKKCECCNQARQEAYDSLWGIEAEHHREALDFYLQSYALEDVKDAFWAIIKK